MSMNILTKEALDALALKKPARETNYIKIGMSTCGIAAGAEDVYSVFTEEIEKRKLQFKVLKCGCLGMCFAEPLVEVAVEGMPTILYGRINRDSALKILDKHIAGKMIIQDFVFEGTLKR